jgi:acetyltransferase-like isoleucine patch superfamily enzyme
MKLIQQILKIAGKDNFQFDERINTRYIAGLCLDYGLMMIRGKIKSLGYSNISKNVFIGKKVRLYSKRNLTVGSKTKIKNGSKIDALSSEGIVIGAQCVFGENTRIECTGSLSCLGRGVAIGDRTTFGSDCFFGAAGGITIGSDVVAGQYIRFHSENHNYKDKDLLIREQGVTHKGIKIGNNCWIGSGAVFLDGAEIGDGCVVAANAVVTKKFPDDSVIGGIPAKIISER